MEKPKLSERSRSTKSWTEVHVDDDILLGIVGQAKKGESARDDFNQICVHRAATAEREKQAPGSRGRAKGTKQPVMGQGSPECI